MKKILLFLSFLLMSIGVFGVDVQCTLTNANIVSAGDAESGYGEWSFTDDCSQTWNAYCIKNKHSNADEYYNFIQIKAYTSNTAHYLQVPEKDGYIIKTITMVVSSTQKPHDGGDNSATYYFSSSNNSNTAASWTSTNPIRAVYDNGTSYITLNCSSLNLTTGYITASQGTRMWGDIVVTYTSAEYTPPTLYSTTFKNYLGVDSIKTQISEGSSIMLPTTMPICNDCYEDNWTLSYWMLSDGTRINSASHTPTKNDTLYPMYWRVSDRIEEVEEYKKVTRDLSPNWAGDYLIAYSSTVFADGRFGGTGVGTIGGQAKDEYDDFVTPEDEIDIVNDTIVTSLWGNTYNVTLEELTENSNTYLLRTKDSLYNYFTNNKNNGITTSGKADDYPITVNFVSENDVRISLGGDATGSVFRWNNGSIAGGGQIFRFYHDCSQSPVYLYKKTKTLKPAGTEYSSIPECDSSYVVIWDSDSLHIDKHRLNIISNPTHITIIDINSGDTLKNHELLSSYYKSNKDEYVIPITLTPNHKLIFLVESVNDSLYLIHKIPFVVKSNKTTSELSDYDDIVIWPENKVTVNGTETSNNNVTIYPNGVLSIPTGTKYTVNSLTLRRDNDSVPCLSYKGTLDISNGLFFEMRADGSDWRWLTLPDTFSVNSIKGNVYNSTNGGLLIKYYNGQYRANNGNGGWKMSATNAEYKPGEGFIFGVYTPQSDTEKRICRVELDASILTKEKDSKSVHVQAYGTSSTPANDRGWNVIGNPYMDTYTASIETPIRLSRLVKSDTNPWDGRWVVDTSADYKDLRYIVVKSEETEDEIAAGGYKSVAIGVDDYELKPFTSFFVQVDNTANIEFNSIGKANRAPSVNRHEDNEETFLRVNIGDRKTGCFISSKFTDDYEVGDDLESIYPIYQTINGYKLLYSAVNDSIINNGITVYTPSGVLSLDDKTNINAFSEIKALYNNELYDLLNGETVEVSGEFVLFGVRKQDNVATGIEENCKNVTRHKVIVNGILYIIVNDNVYNVLGERVR